MTSAEWLRALAPVVAALNGLGVTYRIGGSVASSAHGVARTTVDVDLVADLREEHIEPLVEALRSDFYVDSEFIRDAIQRRSSFNLVHLASMIKVDVFAVKDTEYDRQAFSRQVSQCLQEEAGAARYSFSTAEDTVLQKLRWYRMGGESSERQWTDVTGVLTVQAGSLDESYLDHWAKQLDLEDLLARARSAARD